MSGLLYLFRHGSAAPPGVLAGRTDYPLSARGEAEAEYWAEALAGVPFSAAWTSPLLRARQTATRILSRQPAPPALVQVPGLTEISLGEWDGKTKDRVRREYPDIWEARGRDPAGVPPPGGESFAMLAARVLPAFTALCAEAASLERSLLVAHQAVNRVILARSMGLPLAALLDIAQPPAALSVLRVDSSGPRLLAQHPPPDIA